MDKEARKRLIDKALAIFDTNTLAAVPMVEFFMGNTDDWSFGRHIQTSRDIPITEYAEVFRSVRARLDVHEIYVKLHEIPDDSDPQEREMWPSGFVVFVITSASETEVECWLRQLEPRYIDAGWQASPGVVLPWRPEEFPQGMRPVLVEML